MRIRKQNRLVGFDYASKRYYFVTIRTKNHIYSFGKIENKLMYLSPDGIIAREQWNWLGNQYPYIDLVSFVTMPDHIHGIIYIYADYYNNIGNCRGDNVWNDRDHSIQPKPIQPHSKIKPLPELIGAYKTTVSKRIHMDGDMTFNWQKSYHDHIIRNISSLNRIKHYIKTNPGKWNNNSTNDL